MTIKTILVVLALFGLGGCDNGKWLTLPAEMSDCTNLKDDPKKVVEQGLQLVAQPICLQSGKNYTGDYRCKDGNIQIKCR